MADKSPWTPEQQVAIYDIEARVGAIANICQLIFGDLAKTVAEITYGCDAPTRQRILDDLVREVSEFEAEYANTSGSEMRH